MFSPNRQHYKSARKQSGLNLVELMVAVPLGMVLSYGIIQIYISTKTAYQVQESIGRLQENGRYAIEAIANDLRLARFWGDLINISSATGNVTPAATCKTTNTDWGLMLSQPVFGINNARTGYDCIPSADHKTGSDVLVVRHADPAVVNSYDNNRLYIRTNLFEGAAFKGANQASNTLSGTYPDDTRKIMAHAYYIGPTGRYCNNDGVNVVYGFYREKLNASGKPEKEELIEGVERFQVKYGIDMDAAGLRDGSANRYVDANAIKLNPVTGEFGWNDVVTIRVWLLARSECPESSYTNKLTYTLGDLVVTPNDSFRRHLYEVTVGLRNFRVSIL